MTNSLLDWKFKTGAEFGSSDCEFYYDLTIGGYINPDKLLEDKNQIAFLKRAIAVVQSFEEAYIKQCEDNYSEDEDE
jgi:hypothetical protein